MTTTVFQEGTMQMLIEGLLDGTMSIQELMQHGNYGIGTGQGINGELIILDGKAYHIPVSGKPTEITGKFAVPFASVHPGNYQAFSDYDSIELDDLLADVVDKINGRNQLFTLLVKGEFEAMHTRSAAGSGKPYPSLAKIAEGQREFKAENIEGQLITYFTPTIFQGVSVAGYHSHFLADDLSMGGHVLGGKIKHAQVLLQSIDYFQEHLPIHNGDYLNANLDDLGDLNTIIEKAEG